MDRSGLLPGRILFGVPTGRGKAKQDATGLREVAGKLGVRIVRLRVPWAGLWPDCYAWFGLDLHSGCPIGFVIMP
jgi:hypothetical protein